MLSRSKVDPCGLDARYTAGNRALPTLPGARAMDTGAFWLVGGTDGLAPAVFLMERHRSNQRWALLNPRFHDKRVIYPAS